MMQIGRPEAHAGEIAFRWQDPVAVGAELLCVEGDSAVVFLDGQVLGVLGPGRHALHPSALPALAPAVRPTGQLGVELIFVRTAPLPPLALGGNLGAMRDPTSGATPSARWQAEVRVRVADSAQLAVQLLGMGPAAVDDQLADFVRRAFATAAPEALHQRLGATGSLQATFDPGAIPEIVSAILEAVRPRLAEMGLEPLDIGTCAFDVSGDGPAAGPSAGAVAAGAAAAGAAMASGLSPSGPIPGASTPGASGPGAPASAAGGERTFEMLWDCNSCGTKKNLGLTHSHCPECGAPQDATRRYFPSDDEKVAVEDHVCVGADLKCRYCAQLSGRRAKHCGSCGAPLDEAEEAARRQDQVGAGPYAGESLADAQRERAPAAAPVAAPKKKSGKGRWIAGGCGTLLLLIVVAVLVAVFWRREGTLVVASHSWTREVAIERFGPVQDSAWCDQMPSDATAVRRAREVRSHRSVPDGQECSTRRVDNGDGTYSERQECRTKTRQEPVYDQKCYYTVNRWAQARTATASGAALAPPPQWPPVQLAQQGQCLGCEREGARTESYVVSFLDMESAETATCDFDQTRWATFQVGSSWKGDFTVVGDVLVCDSLQPN